jgi:hypothetical protein
MARLAKNIDHAVQVNINMVDVVAQPGDTTEAISERYHEAWYR